MPGKPSGTHGWKQHSMTWNPGRKGQAMTDLAVVSLSGGMDSCVAAAIARDQGFDLALLHADYGQLTEARERRAYQEIADFYGVPANRRLVISFENLRQIGGSALTDPTIPLPEGDLGRPGIPASYVPFR